MNEEIPERVVLTVEDIPPWTDAPKLYTRLMPSGSEIRRGYWDGIERVYVWHVAFDKLVTIPAVRLDGPEGEDVFRKAMDEMTKGALRIRWGDESKSTWETICPKDGGLIAWSDKGPA